VYLSQIFNKNDTCWFSRGDIMFTKMAMHVVIFLMNFLVGAILGADGKNGVFKIKAERKCKFI